MNAGVWVTHCGGEAELVPYEAFEKAMPGLAELFASIAVEAEPEAVAA